MQGLDKHGFLCYYDNIKNISDQLVPERKPSFSPISVSGSNFNPQNTSVCLRLKFSPSLILTKNPGFRSGTIYLKISIKTFDSTYKIYELLRVAIAIFYFPMHVHRD